MMLRILSILIFCLVFTKLSYSQELSIKVDYRSIFNADYTQAIDDYEIRNKTDRMFNFSVRYYLNKKSSLSFSYAKVVNYSLLDNTDAIFPTNYLLIPNALTINGENIKALSKNGSDRLDSFILTYSYHNLFNHSVIRVNPTLGIELIHTEDEFFYKDYLLSYEQITLDEEVRVTGVLNMDGQYHQRFTPFLKPGIEFGIHPTKNSPVHFTIAINYRFPVFWDLNEVYLNRDLFLDTGEYVNYRTTSINTGRAFELLIGTEISLMKLKRLFR